MLERYRDRQHAGEVLGRELAERGYGGRDDLLVLGLPRGGVPVARQVARLIGGRLDVMLVRKLGVPGQEELAMGAIASGGARVLNRTVVQQLGIDDETIALAAAREGRELARREHAYRHARPEPVVTDRCAILVDDGLATGSSMEVAIAALKLRGPREVIVAVPVAPRETCERLAGLVDAVVCPLTPRGFAGVGQFYDNFEQVTDEQVRETLAEVWREQADEQHRRRA